MTETTDSPSERRPGESEPADEAGKEGREGKVEEPSVEAAKNDTKDESKPQKSKLREFATLTAIALVLYYVMLTFVARPYLIPSESMEPTLHGCSTCVGDRIMVDKLTYRFSSPKPGDVIVFKGPPSWNLGYHSIRSKNPAVRWVQNVLSVIGFVPPDENDLVKRVIAVGGQTVQCRADTGLTVDGKPVKEPYLDRATIGNHGLDRGGNPDALLCQYMGRDWGPVVVPSGRLWVMGDNRSHSSDSRAHCLTSPTDTLAHVLCTGDPESGTVPVDNVIGKARFIVWPPSRWGGVSAINPQQGQ